MEKYRETDLRYLKSLANQYPTVAAAATEIINLQAILSLPKGTEHFITDIHGEYDQFQHVIRNGSGAIKRKIEEEFGNAISAGEKKAIATLIYYPEQKLEQVLKTEENMEDWYKVSLYRLIRICKSASSKYTRSKVRKALPKDFAYVIEELLTGRPDVSDQEAYYNEIIRSVIRTGRAPELVIAFCNLIRRLVVDHLHVVGDIFDRGPYPNLIMDTLMQHHSVDIQWGNHDIYWMGAAAGSRPCICNAIRISAKYGNLNLLEDGYGINLVPLARLAMSRYDKDPCICFKLDYREDEYDVRDAMLDEKMHKAITVIQFKLEGQMIMRHPEFGMDERLLLEEEEVVNRILSEFGLEGAEAHIINGHIPVEAKRGESPVKCGGKLLIIDGGFSKAYQPKTGIAGYTLIYNSYGLVLAAHEPFESVEKAVQDGSDIASHTILVQHVVRRKLVADTDIGRELRASIRDLEALLQAYRDGILVEKI